MISFVTCTYYNKLIKQYSIYRRIHFLFARANPLVTRYWSRKNLLVNVFKWTQYPQEYPKTTLTNVSVIIIAGSPSSFGSLITSQEEMDIYLVDRELDCLYLFPLDLK